MDRIAKIERELKIWRAVGVLGIVAAIAVGAAPNSDVVEAKAFILKDKDGRTRGRWLSGEMLTASGDAQRKALDASVFLMLYNTEGNIRADLLGSHAQAELVLTGTTSKYEKDQIVLTATRDTGTVKVQNNDREINLKVEPHEGGLSIADTQGRAMASIAVPEDGASRVKVMDKDRKSSSMPKAD